jgi:hypothetical protein
MTLLELSFQRRKVRTEANHLLDKAAIESRALSIPEQVRFDALLAQIQELDEQFALRSNLRKMVS